MKVLLDQNTPIGIRRYLSNHTVVHAQELGWGELENGELLSAAEEQGFEIFLVLRSKHRLPAEPARTPDRNHSSQHE